MVGYYAGIGSRETPPDVLEEMTQIAKFLAPKGWTLRSGNADGADRAFHQGAVCNSEIFIPWYDYNRDKCPCPDDIVLWQPSAEAMELAAQYHPAWGRCKQGTKKLHARNSHIILGAKLNKPVTFVVCYTKNGEGGGGTGQALRLAIDAGIKIFDLGIEEVRTKLLETMRNG